jgi:hypothetical protein
MGGGEVSERHEALTPIEQEAINAALINMAKADPANWRQQSGGHRYYVGPQMQGDGSIDWSGHDGWPDNPDDPSP